MTLQFKCGDTYSYHSFDLDQIIKSSIHSYHYFFHINRNLTVVINLLVAITLVSLKYHGDVIKWKHFPRYWPFVQGFTSHRWFPQTKAEILSFDVFFELHLNKRLSKQWWRWWFDTPSCPLWCHCNVMRQIIMSLSLHLLVSELYVYQSES